MSELNNIWKDIKLIQKLAEYINKDWEKYSKSKLDLINEHVLEQEIKKAKSELVSLAIKNTLSKHNILNVTVSDKDRESLEKKDFDEKAIEEYIVENYVKKADELAFKEILSQARELLPRFWEGFKPRKPTINEIVKNKKLILKVYWYYTVIDWRDIGHINALDKLTRIVLRNIKPTQAIGRMGEIVDMVDRYNDFAQAKLYEYGNGIIKSFRIYKNGKLEVLFYKEEDAKKIAEILITDNIDYDSFKSERS